jgi:hypothetical protein
MNERNEDALFFEGLNAEQEISAEANCKTDWKASGVEPLMAARYTLQSMDSEELDDFEVLRTNLVTAAKELSVEALKINNDGTLMATMTEAVWTAIAATDIYPDNELVTDSRARKKSKLETALLHQQHQMAMGAGASGLQAANTPVLKPAEWTDGLVPGLAVQVFYKAHEPSRVRQSRFNPGEEENHDGEFGVAVIEDKVVKFTPKGFVPLPEQEILKPSEFGPSKCVYQCQSELDIKKIPDQNLRKMLLEFPAARGMRRLENKHSFLEFLRQQGFNGQAIDSLQRDWQQYVTEAKSAEQDRIRQEWTINAGLKALAAAQSGTPLEAGEAKEMQRLLHQSQIILQDEVVAAGEYCADMIKKKFDLPDMAELAVDVARTGVLSMENKIELSGKLTRVLQQKQSQDAVVSAAFATQAGGGFAPRTSSSLGAATGTQNKTCPVWKEKCYYLPQNGGQGCTHKANSGFAKKRSVTESKKSDEEQTPHGKGAKGGKGKGRDRGRGRGRFGGQGKGRGKGR